MTAGFRDFEFDLPGALLSTMIVAFDGLEGAPLTGKNVNLIPDAQGVYQLIVNEEIVYIGKTDSEAGLRKRLERHARIIQHRSNLEVSEVYFKAVRVYVFTAMDIETQLIKHYEGQSSVNWNNSGFGSNDPGRNRDMTRAKPDSFDALYPIDLEQTISLELSGEVAVSSALQAIRRALPYTLRVEKKAKHPDFEGLAVTLSGNPLSVKELLTAVVATLPAGWQATALAGRVILYKEKEDNYPAGRIIARS